MSTSARGVVRLMTALAFGLPLGLGLWVRPIAAQDMRVRADLQVPLLAKVLSYDRHLAHRASDDLVVGVLFQDDFRGSRDARDEILRAAEHGSVQSILGVPLRFVAVRIGDETDMERMLTESGVDILYVTPMRSIDIEAIAAACARNGVLTVTGVYEYVSRGIAAGIGEQGGRPVILINRDAAAEQGASFSAQLLKMSTLVGGDLE